MARIYQSMRRWAVVAFVLVGCVLLAEYYYAYYNREPAGENVRNRVVFKDEVDKPVHQKLNKKPQKTPQQVDSSKSARLDFLKTQAAVQAERKAVLRGTCERREVRADPAPSLYTRRHIFVVDAYRLLYCVVPKVGCSNWKRVLMVLNGEKASVEGLTSEEVHLRAQMRFLSSYTGDEQAQRLQSYRKFFFVREPFGRALSVYRNKFEDVGYYRGNRFFHRFGKQIVTKFKAQPSAHDRATGENATWPEFVDYLTHPTERAEVEKDVYFSDHWTEMHKLCSPCTVDYDVIGRLETVADDARYVLDLLEAPPKVRYLSSGNSRPTNSTQAGTFHRYFSQLSRLQLTKLWDLYKLDYELFGYPKPEIVPS